jgi:hypothetical protein
MTISEKRFWRTLRIIAVATAFQLINAGWIDLVVELLIDIAADADEV